MPRSRHFLPLSPALAELERLPQPVVAYGRDLAPGECLPMHSHRRAQLVHASHGVMTVTTGDAAFVVPPERAVWMPGGVAHQIEAHGSVAMRTLYVEAGAAAGLPPSVCVLQVTSLLRELILAAVEAGPVYAPGTAQARAMQVILDQMVTLPVAPLALPMPRDARLVPVARALLDDPADPRTVCDWAAVARMSGRSFIRRFRADTGMSFRAWRQQRRLLRALERLATGAAVTEVALELGYESTSAFIAMFRRSLGASPARYFGRTRASAAAASRSVPG